MKHANLRPLLVLGLGLAASASALAADPATAWREANEAAILEEFTSLLAIPNVVGDDAAIRRNAERIVAMMERRGLAPRLLEGESAAVPPAVYGEWIVPGATRTLVFYAHYDGQPVAPADWASDPWTPVWRDGALHDGASIVTPAPGQRIDPDWRIYGRSASDDKAGVMAILAAVEALRASGQAPSVNLKFFFEGEEEAGSPHLRELLGKHKELLGADAWVICDGPIHVSGRQQVVYGVRGDANVDITVYGPSRPLHSGHYGNWAPNPGMRLAQLLASMKDADGRVTIAGWYDDVIPFGEAELAAIAAAPQADAQIRESLGLAATELPGRSLMEAIALPSLNVNGIRSADVGDKARNVIPTTAAATLDLRLVKGDTVPGQFDKLTRHIRAQGYLVLDREPTRAERLQHPRIAKVTQVPGGYAASRTPMDLPIAQAIARAVQSVAAQPIVQLPQLGGSLPLVVITEVLGAPTITVPIANPDNNQHAENENLRLGNLWQGIATMAALMRLE